MVSQNGNPVYIHVVPLTLSASSDYPVVAVMVVDCGLACAGSTLVHVHVPPRCTSALVLGGHHRTVFLDGGVPEACNAEAWQGDDCYQPDCCQIRSWMEAVKPLEWEDIFYQSHSDNNNGNAKEMMQFEALYY